MADSYTRTIPDKIETIDTNGSYSLEEAQSILKQHEEQRRQEFGDKLNALCEEYGFVLQIDAKIVVSSNG